MELLSPQSILLLDNGAYTYWRRRRGRINRERYWLWVNDAQELCELAIAVIPDVIEGSEEENWLEAAHAIRGQYSAFPERSMFVWHMNESIEQLVRAACLFNYIAIGSCAQYDVHQHRRAYLARLRCASSALDAVEFFYGRRPFVHLMRGLGVLPRAVRFDSADSCNIARNHHRTRGQPRHVARMAHRVEKTVRDQVRWMGPAYPTSNFYTDQAAYPRWRGPTISPFALNAASVDWLLEGQKGRANCACAR